MSLLSYIHLIFGNFDIIFICISIGQFTATLLSQPAKKACFCLVCLCAIFECSRSL